MTTLLRPQSEKYGLNLQFKSVFEPPEFVQTELKRFLDRQRFKPGEPIDAPVNGFSEKVKSALMMAAGAMVMNPDALPDSETFLDGVFIKTDWANSASDFFAWNIKKMPEGFGVLYNHSKSSIAFAISTQL